MRSKYKQFGSGVYFVTSTIVEWINIFNSEKYFDIIIREIEFRKNSKEMKIYGFVIMPNHIHLIVYSDDLSSLMRNFKSFTSKEILKALNEDNFKELLAKLEESKLDFKNQSKYQVWQEGYYPKQIINIQEIEQKLNYIHFNPVRSGLVLSPTEWKYSSYFNYYGGKNIIQIDSYI